MLVNYKKYIKINYIISFMNKYLEYLEKYKLDKSISIKEFIKNYKKLN